MAPADDASNTLSVEFGYIRLASSHLDIMKSQLVPVEELSAGDRAGMFHLLQQHFSGVRIDIFQADLVDKNWSLLLRDATGSLKGFSNILFYQTQFDDQPISVVYSGDTIMDPSAWSSMALAKSWINAITTLKALYSAEKLYWFLISSGYRTYRFMPTFWKEFYPHYTEPTPPAVQRLIDNLATERFGDRYDFHSGVVKLDHPQQLRDQLAGIPAERLTDPHIRFFDQRNPGHINGDELVCLTEICEDNLTCAGQRMWATTAPSIAHS